MFRIDDPSAAAALPTPEAAGTEGYWTEGNPGSGIAATLARASFLNMIQEELRNVVTAAGLTPSKTTYNQLLLALRAAGVFTTPTQFDNTTKAATTAFVKAQGLQAAGISLVTVTSALTAANAGGTVAVNAAGATTQTLPAASAVPSGARIELMNINAGIATVSRAGADTLTVNNATVTSLALGAGDTLTLESDGVSKWYAVGGSAQLGSAAVFAASKASSGFQKLPSGLIIQWGSLTTSNVAVTYPIAFPTNVLVVFAQVEASANTNFNVNVSRSGTTSFSVFPSTTGNTGATLAILWFAIGF